MSDNENSIVSVLRREPEQMALLLKFGLGGPLVIVAWNWLGSMFLSALLIMPFTLLLLLVYAGILGFLIARLVRAADRWEVDSALQARRLLTGSRRSEPPSAETNSLPAAAMAALATPDGQPVRQPVSQADFHRVYFLLRLEEEIRQARREGRTMGLIALDVTVPRQELTPAVREKLSFELADMASGQAKTIGQSLSMGATEFVFSLPHCDEAAAKSFISKMLTGLGNYWCHYGLAVYPQDGTNAEALFDSARARCEDSRQDKVAGRSRLAVAN